MDSRSRFWDLVTEICMHMMSTTDTPILALMLAGDNAAKDDPNKSNTTGTKSK